MFESFLKINLTVALSYRQNPNQWWVSLIAPALWSKGLLSMSFTQWVWNTYLIGGSGDAKLKSQGPKLLSLWLAAREGGRHTTEKYLSVMQAGHIGGRLLGGWGAGRSQGASWKHLGTKDGVERPWHGQFVWGTWSQWMSCVWLSAGCPLPWALR